MADTITRYLSQRNLDPVLVDVGASFAPPTIWRRIAPFATYVGFDPDLRDLTTPESDFRRAIMVNEAVTSQEDTDEITFYFTQFPYCSSILEPDTESLSNYLFCDYFQVESQGNVRASTLNAIVERLELSGIDWFKTDSQGTDLRIYESIDSSLRSRILVADIEPGLIDAYRGEDLYVDAHKQLTREGFWLSHLKVSGSIRIKSTSLEALHGRDPRIDTQYISDAVRQSPGWCGARYLRTVEWLRDHDMGEREYLLLWTFALLDGQPGFAADVALAVRDSLGARSLGDEMLQGALVRLQRAHQRARFVRTILKPALAVRRAMHRVMG